MNLCPTIKKKRCCNKGGSDKCGPAICVIVNPKNPSCAHYRCADCLRQLAQSFLTFSLDTSLEDLEVLMALLGEVT